MAKGPTVESWLAAQAPDIRSAVERLRAMALDAGDGVTEHIKWNGPSFCIDGDDRITVGLAPKGGVRAILHRGVKVKDAADFVFPDETGMIQWAAADRGVVTFADEGAIAANAEAFADICRRWFEATR
ncbi:hypothetical protein GCM10007859_21260 [Brevundimonas denitrificans]|uniref:YdhG-like domain-containing protein n=1 Tax=Brevundimonas denitrificans TaxID=1443434 RepID=A0ABQ6BLV3_9CAUL|nr:DUF1801 domain-containing protein [Brevundimonas denitrificans]GLS02105.1 hypothetical protein GCM10007859_21260 [Brevundimonas denitrificans]